LNIRGLFLSGINEDQMPEALKINPAPPGFLRLPIWISSGINDRIATPLQEEQVKGSLVRTGFQNVRLSRFSGGHEVNRADLQSALKWFREQEHF
jgi:predicted esterase